MKTKRKKKSEKPYFQSRLVRPPLLQAQLDNLRLEATVEEHRKEIKLYRDTLAQIRDIALFGRAHGEGQDKIRAGSSRLVEINNRAFRAFNWRDLENKEEVRELAKLYGLCP